MNKVILSSVVTALLIFSGCADKDPVVDADSQSNKSASSSHSSDEVVGINSETITSNESSVLNESASDSNEMGMANIEKQMESIYFNFDNYAVRSDMQANVGTNANVVNTKASKYTIKLEGNCDEWGSDEYNFALGLKRANAVKKALVAEGVSASRVTMVSYGESNPACVAKTQACWAQNRRVDLKLLP